MQRAACPSRDDLSAFILGKLPDAAWRVVADHSCQCVHCQQQLHGLDAVADPLILQIRDRRLQAIAPELLLLLKKAEGIAVQGGSNTVPPGQTLPGNLAPLTQEARQVLAPPQAADEIGRLGPYRVLKLLGQGGMGMVFLAEDPKLQRTVALKVMLPAVAVNATAKERFLREARATAAIEHDHIVTIHQVDEDRGMPFLAMQLLKGMALEDYLKKAKETKKPITLGQILKLGREIAKGLAIAHERGLIHRDIKPANIWLDATAGGRVKILDFGLARPAAADSTITQSGMIVGTPAYMAPEQATGQPIDGRADLFSLGVVLYRLCSGRLPWKGETAMGTLMAVATEDPTAIQELNPRLPPKLAALVMQLLAKKPENRPASAKTVVAAIQAIEREQAALQVQVATPIEPAPNQWQQLSQDDVTAPLVTKPVRKSPRRWPLVAALLLVACGFALFTPILIRIKNQDGSETVVQVPTGATVTVEQGGQVVARVPDGAGQGGKPQGETDAAWIKQVQALPPDKQMEAVVAKLKERNPGFNGKVEHRLQGKNVDDLRFTTDAVSDISPLRAVPKVRTLYLDGSGPGRGRLADLTPLQGMSVMWLSLHHNPVTDWSPLRGLPLRQVSGSDNLRHAADILRSMPTLEAINNRPVKDVPWLRTDALAGALGPWIRDVQQLPPDKQVEAVAAKLKELNPGFDGAVQHRVEKGRVLYLKFSSDQVADIQPVRALVGLERLHCDATGGTLGKLAGLEALRGLRLTHLTIGSNRGCGDLEPLRGMPLTQLHVNGCRVNDLTPLAGMPLTELWLGANPLTEISTLRGMPLRYLAIYDTKVSDLTPLSGMPLESLDLGNCPVTDLTPLRGLPIKRLIGLKRPTVKPEQHLEVLRSLWSLNEVVGFGGAMDFWKQYDPQHAAFLQWIEDTKQLPAEQQVKAVSAKLQELNPGYDGASPTTIENGRVIGLTISAPNNVAAIAPLRALGGLKRFNCSNSSVADLSPLRGLPLTELRVASTKVVDLSPLSGMPLEVLMINGARVTDLAPLRGMPLTKLICNHTRVADLAPLWGLPLTYLNCTGTPITDFSPLQTLPLKELFSDKLRPDRDAGILRAIQTLEKINGEPAAAFWKQADGK